MKQPIPWTRLIAEGLAIVVSILLAFAIDAWWEQRQDTAEERRILVSLRDEFTEIRALLNERSLARMPRFPLL
jgi:hypothetical protein